MAAFIVHPVDKILGVLHPSGAKNSALPILVATCLVNDHSLLGNVPQISDVKNIIDILRYLGAEVNFENNQVRVCHQNLTVNEIPYQLTQNTRAAILFLGAMITKFEHIKMGLPGGCAIGEKGMRGMNFHLQALEKMGVVFKYVGEYLLATRSAKGLVGANITLGFPTVTGTENIIVAAVLAQGTTCIKNAAREPEVVDLINFLNQCGAKIEGGGTSLIRIEGVSELRGCEFRVIPDRIEVGTFLALATASGSTLRVEGCEPSHLSSVLDFLKLLGADVEVVDQTIELSANRALMQAHSFKTGPHPAFPTDLQAQFLVLNVLLKGEAVVEDCVFTHRFGHVWELNKMGAGIVMRDRKAYVPESSKLKGVVVCASDLRASSSLVIAGLLAKGVTQVLNTHHLERGYENFCEKIRCLGGNIERQ